MTSSKYKPIGTYLKYHNTKVIYNGIKFDSIYKNIVMQKN
jgi:hypothetical protein